MGEREGTWQKIGVEVRGQDGEDEEFRGGC